MGSESTRHDDNVGRLMLPVGIGRDDAGVLGEIGRDIVDAGLQRRPFSEISFVPQHPHSRERSGLLEQVLITGAASVIDHDDRFKRTFNQRLEQLYQHGTWLIGWYDYSHIHSAAQFTTRYFGNVGRHCHK
jgi:hypothetical protein